MKILACLSVITLATTLVSCKDGKSGAAASNTVVLATADGLPKTGAKFTTSRTMAVKEGSVKISAGGQNMDGTMNLSDSETEDVEIAAPDKIKVTVTAGEKVQAMKLNGQELPNEPVPPQLLKAPVTFTKAAGKWTGALDTGTPTDVQKAEIAKRERKFTQAANAAMYGTAPRKVGETWSVDAARISFAEGTNDVKGSVTLTFKGIEDHGGRKCARLEGPMEFSGKTDADKGGQDLTMKGDIVVLRAIDEMVDLQTTFKGRMEMKGTIPGGSMAMEGSVSVDEHTELK
ncbi:hypothetical protein [Luteolibacter sp. LG18]|uniref:hypothetical protein n=1 Tax=Luteolibacter sp. LG18 TaxID=2819286 RepID=UPI002B30FE67|nr:hypothetical protein llg_12900 [Luteolibacter sp. LG18]